MVRVKSFAVGMLPTVYTQTYIFPAAVTAQPALPAGYPAQWQSSLGATTPADYQMDPQVTGTPDYIGRQTEILHSLPSVAISLPSSNLFGVGTGIYSNPLQSGDAWERAASVELILPGGEKGFQVDAGIRIEGGDTRDPANTPKHSLRIRFDADYGPSELEYQVFPTSELDEFDSLSLRAPSTIPGSTPMERRGGGDVCAASMAARLAPRMGQPAVDGQFVHLYLNGLYWGVYNLSERIDDNFAGNRFGGRNQDYDVIDTGQLSDGQITGWNAMMAVAAGGLTSSALYQAIQQYLNVPNFIDYMIVNILAGKNDLEEGDWFAVRNRVINEPFRFYVWDSERVLRGSEDDQSNVTGANSPAYLYQQLRANADFRLAFADRLQKHFFGDGALTSAANAARWSEIAATLEPALLAESARWGDYRRDVHPYSSGPYELYGPSQWQAESERLLDEYFPERTNTVLGQFIDNSLYPGVAAPTVSRPGGQISVGTTLALSAGRTGLLHRRWIRPAFAGRGRCSHGNTL